MSKPKMLYCQSGTADGTGYQSEEGFVVLAGSVISDHTTKSFECASKCYLRLRLRLLEDGTIRDRIFVRDHIFSSATAAGAVLTGRTISGRIAWKETKKSG